MGVILIIGGIIVSLSGIEYFNTKNRMRNNYEQR